LSRATGDDYLHVLGLDFGFRADVCQWFATTP
jgi:hypothetical protein